VTEKVQMTKSSARAAIRLLITSFFITYLVSEISFPVNMAFIYEVVKGYHGIIPIGK
jgi:hypothetical protein